MLQFDQSLYRNERMTGNLKSGEAGEEDSGKSVDYFHTTHTLCGGAQPYTTLIIDNKSITTCVTHRSLQWDTTQIIHIIITYIPFV